MSYSGVLGAVAYLISTGGNAIATTSVCSERKGLVPKKIQVPIGAWFSMRLNGAGVVETATAKRVRITADVTYRDGASEVYWFEVGQELTEDLSPLGNPWLALLLPLAVTMGEPLEIPAPVDPILFEGARQLMHVWQTWDPQLHIVPVEADVLPLTPRMPGEKIAAFFSGGVDSFFTALRHSFPRSGAPLRIDELLFFWKRMGEERATARVRRTVEGASAEMGIPLVVITSNINETRWVRANWPRLAHGSFMGALALLLERRYSTVMIASSYPYSELHPWGSHPLTDPMLSTSGLRLVHDGTHASRVDKLKEIARSDIALRYLRTCSSSLEGDNCCICSKCYRVMATLAALDVLDKATTFRGFRVERLAGMYTAPPDMPVMRKLESFALAVNKPELARALRHGMRYSRRRHIVLPVLRWLQRKRFIRRFANRLEKLVFARAFLLRDPFFIQSQRKLELPP